MEDKIILTDNGKIVLAYMQKNDEILVGKDIGDKIGIKGIYPVLTSLVNKGLVRKEEPVQREFTNAKGESKLKDYKTYQLTDKGRIYQIY